MAHIFADNVREGSITEGVGDFVTTGGVPSPGGVIIGRTLDEVLMIGDTFDYTIFHTTLNEWEIGVGTYISPNSFSRDPSSSSNGGNLVSFSPGEKQVFIAPVAARMSDSISDANLPQTQTGKMFTSTVTITGESGLRVNYGPQQISLGGTSADPPDFATCFRNVNNTSTWYIDADKLADGIRIRAHNSGDNFRDSLSISPDGAATLNNRDVKVVSDATTANENSFPIGHTLLVNASGATPVPRNGSNGVRFFDGSVSSYVLTGGSNQGDPLFGTWRARGRDTNSAVHLMERVA